MQCTNPIGLKHLTFPVPCGKCTSCRISRVREWSIRILHESDYHENNLFLTLTYNDDNLPDDLSLNIAEFQAFMKRLRKRLNYRIKYYACGEYGEKYNRPHYHAIIFGMSLKEKPLIEESWEKGFVHVGYLSYDSARYTAEYVQKKYSGPLAESVYGNRQIPFQLQSQGIGRQFALDNEKQIRENLYLTVKGVKHSIPRYYRKILGITDELYYQLINDKKDYLEDKYGSQFIHSNKLQIHFNLIQADKNINAKNALKSKKL